MAERIRFSLSEEDSEKVREILGSTEVMAVRETRMGRGLRVLFALVCFWLVALTVWMALRDECGIEQQEPPRETIASSRQDARTSHLQRDIVSSSPPSVTPRKDATNPEALKPRQDGEDEGYRDFRCPTPSSHSHSFGNSPERGAEDSKPEPCALPRARTSKSRSTEPDGASSEEGLKSAADRHACAVPSAKPVEGTATPLNTLYKSEDKPTTGLVVSSRQGPIDWVSLSAAPVSFVYVKATTGDSELDPCFVDHWQVSIGCSLHRGAYHVFEPCVDGVTQAERLLNVVGDSHGDLPFAVSLERLDLHHLECGQQEAMHRLEDLLQAVEKETRQTAVIRLNHEQYSVLQGLGSSVLDAPLWLHHPGSKSPRVTDYPSNTRLVEPSLAVSVPGVGGTVDMLRKNRVHGLLWDNPISVPEPPLSGTARQGYPRGAPSEAGAALKEQKSERKEVTLAFHCRKPKLHKKCELIKRKGGEFKVSLRKEDASDSVHAYGVDVSHYMGIIDWVAAKGDGVSFAYMKATEGKHFVDQCLESNWNETGSNNLPRGSYHVFHPEIDGTRQAMHYLCSMQTVAGSVVGELPPVLDLERRLLTKSTVDKKTQIERMRDWLAYVEEHTGQRPMLYAGRSTLKEFFGTEDPLLHHGLWFAEYTLGRARMPKGWGHWTFWQFSEKADVAGIMRPVDLNRFEGTAVKLRSLVGMKSEATQEKGRTDN